MKVGEIIARVLLGLVFVVFGSNAFLHFIKAPPMSGPSGDFINAMMSSGYVYVVGFCQVAGGLQLSSRPSHCSCPGVTAQISPAS
jgi:putative oxidoreductase